MEFEQIYKTYHKDVYRLAYSYVLNKQDAEDIMQKSFLKLYKNIKKVNNSSNDIKKWLFRITINDCKDLLRTFKFKTLSFVNEENIINNEDYTKNDLIYFLKSIPLNYRVPLFLHYYEGYNVKEIAKIMHKSESSIKMRLSRGREILKKEMEEN